MRLEQSFEVPVPVGQAWSVLLDIERIAPCMPGATLTDFDGEKFTGVVKVKLGPVQLSYRGSGRFVERDEANRRVVITAAGQDNRGGGGAQAKVTAQLREGDSGSTTQVNVVADLDIAGRAAQFGRGMIGDVSNKLVKQFADCLAQTIAAQGVGVRARCRTRTGCGGGPGCGDRRRGPDAATGGRDRAAASSSDPDAATGSRDRGHSARRAGLRGQGSGG